MLLGGEGKMNAIVAGCDTIEHAFDLSQVEADMRSQGLSYDPTFVRYTERIWTTTQQEQPAAKYG